MADTTSLSSFPTSIDTFERMSDISSKPVAEGQQSTLEKSKIYKEMIEGGNYEDAEKYLKENEDLARCGINAIMINKHSDAIVAAEENIIKNKEELSKLNTIHLAFTGDSVTNSTRLNVVIGNNIDSFANIEVPQNSQLVTNTTNGKLKFDTTREFKRSISSISPSSEIKICGSFNGRTLYQMILINKEVPADSLPHGVELSPKLIKDNINWDNINLLSSTESERNIFNDNSFIENFKIIDVSGFLTIPSGIEGVPSENYPLNSSKIDMYWTDYNKTSNMYPNIHIQFNEVQSKSGYVTVTILVKFIIDKFII